MPAASPRISIGLPVFNGERFLLETLESIAAQTFGDFEVAISDNASTDATGEIARDFALRDSRFVYSRSERNLGAAPNYNRAYSMTSGPLFKWAAHDDVLAPTYLERCLAQLEAVPDAVLCQSLFHYIDESSQILGTYASELEGVDGDRASGRFAAVVLKPHPCNEFFGLIRREALTGSLLHASFHGADRALMAQLALRGRLLVVRDPLLRMREHLTRYTRSAVRPADRLAWHDASRAGVRELPTLRLYREYLAMVRSEPLEDRERRACLGYLARWWVTNWNAVRVAVDGVSIVFPGAVSRAEAIKHRLFRPAPGWGAYAAKPSGESAGESADRR